MSTRRDTDYEAVGSPDYEMPAEPTFITDRGGGLHSRTGDDTEHAEPVYDDLVTEARTTEQRDDCKRTTARRAGNNKRHVTVCDLLWNEVTLCCLCVLLAMGVTACASYILTWQLKGPVIAIRSSAVGPPGEPGLRGVTGRPGFPGVDGLPGDTPREGADGLHGFPGAKGDTGDPGPLGPTGLPASSS